jgi:hypothetical protein
MLSSISKNCRPLCKWLVLLLFSSWASYVCQACCVETGPAGSHELAAMRMPCHHFPGRQVQHRHHAKGKPDSHPCECHFFISLLASNPDTLFTAATSQGFDLPLHPLSLPELEVWPALARNHTIYPGPERATSPPFIRYTVLLN